MAYYLSFDGVDDTLKAPAMSWNKVEMDIVVDSTPNVFRYVFYNVNNYIRLNGNAWQFGSFTVTGNVLDARSLFTLTTANGVQATATNIFCGASSTQWVKGKIYSIKYWNGTSLVAHYDMTLGDQVAGTVQDQSGNGNHATLGGGPVWVSDAGTGTPGSVSYATKQSIFQTSSVALATKQVINQSGSTAYATKQIIAQTASVLAATKQTIYQVGSVSYTTQQTITDGGIPGSIGYSTKQIIYQVSSAQAATKQAIYQNGSVLIASKQVIYRIGADPIATKQIVFNVGSAPIPTKQIIYANGSVAYATKQTVFDPQQQIIGTIELKGSRALYVYLLASRELTINLKGALPVAEENQNISMYASESKIVEYTATDSNTGAALPLTGATVKWGMRRSNSKTNDLVKDSNSGIVVTNAAAGKFTVTLSPTDTVNLSGDFVYQAEVIDSSGFENVVATGRVAIGKNINK